MTAETIERGQPSHPDLVADLVTEAVRAVLGPVRTRSVVVAMSKDENPKATVLVRPEWASGPSLVVKVGTTAEAKQAVLREAAALRRLEQLDPSRLHATVPSCLDLRLRGTQAVLVTSICPGVPLSTTYHRWRHTASADRVRADFASVAAWLTALGRLGADEDETGLAAPWADRLLRRWPDDEVADTVARAVADRHDRLGPVGGGGGAHIVHGDFWCGNVLHRDGAVTGVVDWEHSHAAGDPVRDRVRFALAYALYLDRHTPAGRRVAGHPGLVAGPWAEPIRHVLRATGWFPELVAGFVGDGLLATGRDPLRWRDALLLGIAEVAALSDHADFARQHLQLAREALAWLP